MKAVLATILLIMTAGIVYAATSYRYQCPKCGLIQEYAMPGAYKCPTDGIYMIPTLSH